MNEERTSATIRREPPPFRRVAVTHTELLGPRLLGVSLGGDELAGMRIEQPAASVRLLIPGPINSELIMPVWNGNEFLFDDGTRPIIRTFTPRRLHEAENRIDLEVVLHDGGLIASWAEAALPGAHAAISGPGRGFVIDDSVAHLVLAGDETAVPAIAQLLETTPTAISTRVHLEVDGDFGTVAMPDESVDWRHLTGSMTRGDLLLAALSDADLGANTHVWCAGEAAAMHRVRKYLFQERGLDRKRATVRGYWKRR